MWNDDGTPYGGGSSHRFISGLPGPLVNSPSVADIIPATSGLEIAIGRADSSVAVYNSTDGTPEWLWPGPMPPLGPSCLDRAYRASTPVLGDIDADGKLELAVVLATEPGVDNIMNADSVFVLEDTGQVLGRWGSGQCPYAYPYQSDFAIDHDAPHVAPLAIGNLDEDSRLELFAAGTLWGGSGDTATLTTHGFALDLAGTTLNGTAVPDSIPRRHETQPLNSREPFGQPALADIDGDAVVECLYTTTLGGIFAVDPARGTPDLGWPLQITESIVGAPAAGSFTSRHKLDLVVLDRGGAVYLFNTGADSASSRVEWGQFGGNAAHTFAYPSGGGGDSAAAPGALALLGRNYPNPFNPETRIAYWTSSRQKVSVNVYSASGRAVRTLFDGVVDAGVHRIDWDGEDASGRPAASGVYFYRLASERERLAGKMLLLR